MAKDPDSDDAIPAEDLRPESEVGEAAEESARPCVQALARHAQGWDRRDGDRAAKADATEADATEADATEADATETPEDDAQHRLQLQAIELFGTIDFDPEYDYKTARQRK